MEEGVGGIKPPKLGVPEPLAGEWQPYSDFKNQIKEFSGEFNFRDLIPFHKINVILSGYSININSYETTVFTDSGLVKEPL